MKANDYYASKFLLASYNMSSPIQGIQIISPSTAEKYRLLKPTYPQYGYSFCDNNNFEVCCITEEFADIHNPNRIISLNVSAWFNIYLTKDLKKLILNLVRTKAYFTNCNHEVHSNNIMKPFSIILDLDENSFEKFKRTMRTKFTKYLLENFNTQNYVYSEIYDIYCKHKKYKFSFDKHNSHLCFFLKYFNNRYLYQKKMFFKFPIDYTFSSSQEYEIIPFYLKLIQFLPYNSSEDHYCGIVIDNFLYLVRQSIFFNNKERFFQSYYNRYQFLYR